MINLSILYTNFCKIVMKYVFLSSDYYLIEITHTKYYRVQIIYSII